MKIILKNHGFLRIAAMRKMPVIRCFLHHQALKNDAKTRQNTENHYQHISGKLGTLLSNNLLKPIIISKTFTFF
jgi:hypothetical protein